MLKFYIEPNMETVYFLCGHFLNKNFIYAIKSYESDWYYFKEIDSLFTAHVSLPPDLANKISRLICRVKPIAFTLNDHQFVNYVSNGKFVFKGEELKTCIELEGITANQGDHQPNPSKKSKSKTARDLVFEAGKSNPAIFLKNFEKCSDLKTEKDKLYELRHFVNENDKAEFSKLFFKSDWQRARSLFLQKYSREFTENKNKELSLRFAEETGLRSFVARKMDAMSTYTSLSIANQLEIILSELPNAISNIFIVEDKLNSTKAEILEFCDLVQEHCESTSHTETTTFTNNSEVSSEVDQESEIFVYQEGVESDTGSTSTNSSDQGRVKKLSRSGFNVKIPRTISEEFETSTDSDSNQMDEN